MKEPMNKNLGKSHFFGRDKKKTVIIILVVFLVIILISSCVLLFIKNKKRTTTTTTVVTNQNTGTITAVEDNTDNNSGSTSTVTQPAPTQTASDYYDDGQSAMADQRWQDAVTSFDSAIALNSKVPEYYLQKSLAQYNLNDKSGAIVTLQQGLVTNPNSSAIQSRLNVLQTEETPKNDYSNVTGGQFDSH